MSTFICTCGRSLPPLSKCLRCGSVAVEVKGDDAVPLREVRKRGAQKVETNGKPAVETRKEG